ncbi:MAG: family 1 glycosylhydrolase [Propionicimonas sp.]|uniref:family 1 glycosylhydrolase n=1 Tax=Propionicimonas sp. TaxID=1955623 RepID=UPI002B1FB415|nr:family 1 glycosylhydrolase [Propionicimonas sp.]MEA4944681.1 family 1 glycosylhydrolase [Propionicimonas sp.]MEA5052710.1 family 1 glycosylhydrolase [Propionicimonas sp.]MEA5116635.1 family 1 glycosylhydrolase [Propionicimonas sp.]
MTTATGPAWYADGRFHYGVGIEDTFIPQERPGHRKLDLYELTQHYDNWRIDLALAAQSGAELIRWGIPWYLTEPSEGRFDFRWIDEVAETLDQLGLRCVVDLMHYGTPLWLENAFLDPRYPDRVARYAGEIAGRYRGVFSDYTPLNEPMVNAEWCGYRGGWPPYLSGDSGFVRLAMILVDGMRRSQAAIREADPGATIVAVEAGFQWTGDFGPGRPKDFLDEWRFVMADLLFGRVGADHPLRPYLLTHGARAEQLDEFAATPVLPDVLGINYYPGFTRQGFDPATGSSFPVEAGRAGLLEQVRSYHARYGLPLAITETSRPSAEPGEKIAWLDDLAAAVAELRSDGIDLVAGFWFPMLDMFEWEYRFDTRPLDDFRIQFGLVDLVRGPDNRLQRIPNRAYRHYQKLAAAARDGGAVAD